MTKLSNNDPVGKKITPMMKQFLDLKEQYYDCILLFRAGDFYETFYDDAKVAAKVLNITLTKRGDTPMAGVPYHSIKPYIKKLIENNFKVALCEQLEDPKLTKGLVKRGVTRIITPGTILEDEYLSSNENNFIFCIYNPKNISEKYGISLVDITTGEFFTIEVSTIDEVKTLIKKYSPNEIILNENNFSLKLKNFISNQNIYFNFLSEIRFNFNYAKEILKKQFKVSIGELNIKDKNYSIISSGALLFYIYKLQKLDLSHINKIKYINNNNSMILDSISIKNLELIESNFSNDKQKTLFGILNKTKTPAGSRLLKKHLLNPLININEINLRLDSVEEFNEFILLRDEIRDFLDDIFDIERITSRISSELASPKDLYSLKISLMKLPEIKKILLNFNSKLIKDIRSLEVFPNIIEILDNAIVEDAPSHIRDMGYIKKNYDSRLKELFDISYNSKEYLKKFEETERLKTKISILRVKYNRIFGYYIEIPKSKEKNIPENYILKQTLMNVNRYTTIELKEKESIILNSDDKIKNLEKELFKQLIFKLKSYIKNFQKTSEKLALLDVLTTHSLNSQIQNYNKPKFNLDKTEIIEGRNPIVEEFVSNYIPNETNFNENDKVKIITGPNMSGKSTYLRQNGLIVILAQIGSFVPVKSANIKIYDRIFTRIGAHDELAEGHSTFMVEMIETANILNNVTSNSLVLLDEIGRGTSTYDGLAIAWAVIEELNDKKSDCIFATHYHQLNKLSEYFETINNYNVLVREEGDKVEFLRKIVPGGTDKSYGIYVGKIAGIPNNVLERAKEIQKNIEEKEEIIIKKEFKESLIKKSKQGIKSNNKDLGGFI